jgi:hypothetical protein
MVELKYEDDEVGEEGRHDSDGEAGGFDDVDDAGITELKGSSSGSGAAVVVEACRRVWWAVRHVEWGDILLHDALPPFVSYWGIWAYAAGYTWGLTAQWLAFIPLLLASLTSVYVRTTLSCSYCSTQASLASSSTLLLLLHLSSA